MEKASSFHAVREAYHDAKIFSRNLKKGVDKIAKGMYSLFRSNLNKELMQ